MSVTVRLSSKGQLTLPLAVRKELQLSQGDLLELEVHDGRVVLSPIGGLDDLTAQVTSWITPGTPPVTDVSGYYEEHRGA
ncbi:MAG: AbrB/MazE/SpoVT family DNA-binding domain-containing protein [Tessaracoccus sp.]